MTKVRSQQEPVPGMKIADTHRLAVGTRLEGQIHARHDKHAVCTLRLLGMRACLHYMGHHHHPRLPKCRRRNPPVYENEDMIHRCEERWLVFHGMARTACGVGSADMRESSFSNVFVLWLRKYSLFHFAAVFFLAGKDSTTYYTNET